MAQAAVPLLILTTAAGGVMSYMQGRAIAAENRRAAQASKISAQSKEIARRRGLLKTLAAQNNIAGGLSGQTPNEGFRVIQENDLKWYDLDIQTASVEEQINQSIYRSRASNAVRSGTFGAIDRFATGAWQYSLIN